MVPYISPRSSRQDTRWGRSIHTTQSDKPPFVAAIGHVRHAGAARAVVYDGLHAHAVSRLESGDAVTYLLYCAAELMAERYGSDLPGDGVRGCGD